MSQSKPSCFIAMPVTTRQSDVDSYGDPEHWLHVMDSLFVPAVEAAGYDPIRPISRGAHLIHAQIVNHLARADLVLCDLSAHNPNVFFELGVRTSLNLPVALIRDEQTELPFDTSGINTHTYASKLQAWDIEGQKSELSKHIVDSARSCNGTNPLWRTFGLTIQATAPQTAESPTDAKLDLLLNQVTRLQRRMDNQTVLTDGESGYFRFLGEESRMRDLPAREIFLKSVRQYAETKKLAYSVVPHPDPDPARVDLYVDYHWNAPDFDRIHSLASTYNINLRVLTGPVSLPAND